MGKRSDYERVERDFYPTPWQAVEPLIPHLPKEFVFAEPCADADWMHTKQSASYLPLLKKVVSIGRVQWIPDSKSTGKDNCCWYLFDSGDSQLTQFVGRKA